MSQNVRNRSICHDQASVSVHQKNEMPFHTYQSPKRINGRMVLMVDNWRVIAGFCNHRNSRIQEMNHTTQAYRRQICGKGRRKTTARKSP